MRTSSLGFKGLFDGFEKGFNNLNGFLFREATLIVDIVNDFVFCEGHGWLLPLGKAFGVLFKSGWEFIAKDLFCQEI